MASGMRQGRSDGLDSEKARHACGEPECRELGRGKSEHRKPGCGKPGCGKSECGKSGYGKTVCAKQSVGAGTTVP